MLKFINKISLLTQNSTKQIISRTISDTKFITQKGNYIKRYPSNASEFTAQDELLTTAVQNDNIPTIAEWSTLKKSILSQGKVINEVNFDTKAIGKCIIHKNYEAGKTFIQSIQPNHEKMNIAAVGKFMRLYYACSENKSAMTDEKFIITMYYSLKEKYPILASITAENFILALSLTKEWKQCLELLQNLKITANASALTYSAVIKAAFDNNENTLGWDLMKEMIALDRLPLPFVYNTWLEKSTKSKDFMKDFQYLLDFLADNEVLPAKEVTENIIKILHTKNYSGTYTTMNNRGVCQNCRKPLQKIDLNLDEFAELKSTFMNKVIIGKNLFNKTTPEELDKFKNFVSNSDSYDIVIDGLNVAYSAGNKKSPQFYAKLLANVVRHYRRKSKSVLVLGRVHMYKWPKQYMDYVHTNSSVFLAQNISQDDPFLLYATMAGGLGTCFLSRDFMRGHLYLLMDPQIKILFRRWQRLHQHSLIFVENNGQVHIKSPMSVLPTAQNSAEGWHIPYTDLFLSNPPMSLEPPQNWLCLKKRMR